MTITDYVQRLYQAFATAPRPEHDEITPHRCGECDEVAARLSRHAARDVPRDDMLWLGDSLPLLGPKAFRYYLPRFIEFCLVTPQSSADAVINYNLAPSGDLDVGARNRFANFSDAERRVVLEFVEYRAGLPDSEFDQRYLEDALIFGALPPSKQMTGFSSACSSATIGSIMHSIRPVTGGWAHRVVRFSNRRAPR